MSRRDEYIQKMKDQLDELNAKLAELEAMSASANAEVRAQYSERKSELDQHISALKTRLDELRAAGEDKWNELVQEGDKVYKAFLHSFNYFKSQL